MKKKIAKGQENQRKKAGAKSKYSIELAEDICKAIASRPVGLRTICADNKSFPSYETIQQWLLKHEEFSKMYARAKIVQGEALLDEVVEISDDRSQDIIETSKGSVINFAAVARDRLKVDSRKWIVTKLIPHKYGERVTQVVECNLSNMSDAEISKTISALSLETKKMIISSIYESMKFDIESVNGGEK